MTDLLQIEYVDIADLTEHPLNVRSGDVGAISTSINAHGQYRPLVVQASTGFVIAGNHTLKALRALGTKKVAVTRLDKTDDEAVDMMLSDNRTSDMATYNDADLAELLQAVASSDRGLDATGFDGDDLDQLITDLAMEEAGERAAVVADPEPTVADEALVKWGVKLGDVWRAGDHTVVCGDATDPASYALLGEHVFDAMWTDPPYGVDHAGGSKDPRSESYRSGDTLQNDNLSIDATAELFNSVLGLAPLRAGAVVSAAAPAGPPLSSFLGPLVSLGWLRQCLVWVKQQAVFGRSDYHYQHEMVLYGWKPGAAHAWYGDRKQTSVLQHDRPHRSPMHPTTKPVSLISQCLENSCTLGDKVLDPFCGSGSTLLACQHLGLSGYGIELEPKFVAVTLQRLADIGLEPTLSE